MVSRTPPRFVVRTMIPRLARIVHVVAFDAMTSARACRKTGVVAFTR